LQVPTELDNELREFLKMEKGTVADEDIAAFIQDAVRARIFDLCAGKLKDETAKHDPAFIEDLIEEALTWARQRK
jgi:hypothetical protein